MSKNKDKLRGIFLSDIHFGISRTDKLYEELEEVFFPYLEENSNDIDFVMLTGDISDRKLSLNEKPSKLYIKFIDRLLETCYSNDIKIRIIKGTSSHELNQLENFRHYETNFDFRIINHAEVEELFPNYFVLYIPEEYMEDQHEFYKEFTEGIDDNTKYDLIAGHGTWDFVSFENQKEESERPIKGSPVFSYKEWKDRVWGVAIFGHIHTRQNYRNKIYYVGSFTRWCHGEPKPKGFIDYVYDTNELTASISYVENHLAPEYITVNMSDILPESSTVEEKMKIIESLKKNNKNIKIRFDNSIESSQLAVLQEAFSMDNLVRIDVDNRLNSKTDEEENDDTFDFIIKREMNIPNTIKKYIDITKGREIPLEIIEEIILPEE